MTGKDYILLAIILIAVVGAIRYIYKVKKSGSPCIGCPYSGSCNQKAGNCHVEGEGCQVKKDWESGGTD